MFCHFPWSVSRSTAASQRTERMNRVSSPTLTPTCLSFGLRKWTSLGACLFLGQTSQIQIVQESKPGNMEEKKEFRELTTVWGPSLSSGFLSSLLLLLKVCPWFVLFITSKVVVVISTRDRERYTYSIKNWDKCHQLSSLTYNLLSA